MERARWNTELSYKILNFVNPSNFLRSHPLWIALFLVYYWKWSTSRYFCCLLNLLPIVR